MRDGIGPVDVASVHQDATAARRFQSRDQTQQRGLAAAARSEQCHELAGAGEDVDAIEHRQMLSVHIEVVAQADRLDRQATDSVGCGMLRLRDYHRSRPFCHASSRSRRRNSRVIRPLHISAITISAAYMFA